MQKKRIASLLLAGAMVSSIFTTAVFAEEVETSSTETVKVVIEEFSPVLVINGEIKEDPDILGLLSDQSNVVVNSDINAGSIILEIPDSDKVVEIGGIAISAYESEITVNGDVFSEKASAIDINNTDLTVNGNVESAGSEEYCNTCAVNAGENSSVNISGDVIASGEPGEFTGISALNIFANSSANVEGNVIANNSCAISASYNSTVTVGKPDKESIVVGYVDVLSGSEVNIYGDILSEDNIAIGGVQGNLYVSGDVEGVFGYIVDVCEEVSDSNVIIEGTLKSNSNYGSAIHVVTGDGNNTDTSTIEIPDIIVYALDAKSDEKLITVQKTDMWTGENISEDIITAVEKAVYASVQYIVNADRNGFELSGTQNSTDGDYEVAYEGNKLTVKSKNEQEIESVNAGTYANVIKNEDGTYTILVNRGGDLTITVNLKEIPVVVTTTVESETFAPVATIKDELIIGTLNKNDGIAEPVVWKTLRTTRDMLRIACKYTNTEISPEEYVKTILGEELYSCVTAVKTMSYRDSMQFFGNAEPHIIVEFDMSRVNINADGTVTLK